MAGIDNFTKLLLHCDGTDGSTSFPDSSFSNHTVTANGDAQVDTADKQFGTGALLCDGTGDYLTVGDSDDWDFGTGDWTIDFWFNTDVTTQDLRVIEVGEAESDGIHWKYTDGIGQAECRINGNNMLRSFSFSIDTWYHIECSRSGSTVKMFVDGTQVGSDFTNSSDVTSGTDGVTIGADTAGNLEFDGHIDEVRISKGIARHTSNFTPPTGPYTGEVRRASGTIVGSNPAIY